MNGAIYFIRAGRGYGVQRVPVVDMALAGGRVVHVLEDRRPLCGRKGDLGEILLEVDPRAVRVDGLPVCASCRERLGDIPSVEYVRDIEVEVAS